MRGGFWMKVAAGLGLAAFADFLFFEHEPGWTLGLFALAWTLAVAACLPAARRHSGARLCLAAAAALGVALIEEPNPIVWLTLWAALSTAALLPGARFADAIGWGVGLFVHGLTGLVRPLRDLIRLARVRRARGIGAVAAAVRLLAVPVLGGALFVALFAGANPLIADALAGLALPLSDDLVSHTLFLGIAFTAAWPSLRPGAWRPGVGIGERSLSIGLPAATLVLSLAVFNAIFAIENALDLAFLWSGAPLPGDVTLADYAHRGAYTLIVTALLAGLFVLVALDPGSEAAASRTVRRLLVLWIAQNLLLVASSMRRLGDYVAAYSLTELRIAAFAWMGLVAAGLVLVCWRLIAGRSTGWLVNAAVGAAGLVLVVGSMADFAGIAARYNVRHAGADRRVDLCYLASLGPSALMPMIELERRAAGQGLRDRLAGQRTLMLARLGETQADWRQWTWRGARRLAAANAAAASLPAARAVGFPGCRIAAD